MQIFALGEAQSLDTPGKFLEPSQFGKVVGIAELGANNSENHYGWTGRKAIIRVDQTDYLLDFPETVSLRTETGFEILRTDCGEGATWHPDTVASENSNFPLRDLRS